MTSIIFTPIDTKIEMLEALAQKNTETLIRAYPGVIHCKGSLTCESRRSVAATLFHQCLDVYANLKKLIKVIVANSNAKFIPSGQYLDHKLRGMHATYMQTSNVLQKYHIRAKRNPAMLTFGMAASAVSQTGLLIRIWSTSWSGSA